MDAYAKAQGFSGGSSSEYDIQVMILLMIAKDLYLFHTEEDVAYADIVIADVEKPTPFWARDSSAT